MAIEVKLEKAKREIVDLINKLCNEYDLSCYLLDFIFKEIMEEIQKGRNSDIEMINSELEKMNQQEENKVKEREVNNGKN